MLFLIKGWNIVLYIEQQPLYDSDGDLSIWLTGRESTSILYLGT